MEMQLYNATIGLFQFIEILQITATKNGNITLEKECEIHYSKAECLVK